LLDFKFNIKYKIYIRFGFRFFKYLFYNKILVFLVFPYIKLKFLSSLGRFGIISEFLIDVSGNFKLINFSRFFRF